jgi:hypothetical protein
MEVKKMAVKGKGLAKGILNTFTMPNKMDNGGGFSSLLIRRRLNPVGGLTVMGVAGGAALFNEGLKGRNRAALGRVSYSDGMARMTSSFTSGAVPAMYRASGGNYEVFSDMAKSVVTTPGSIDDYGASPALISALYGMGGR